MMEDNVRSSPMNGERDGWDSEERGPWWRSKTALAVCVAFAVPLVFSVFAQTYLAVPVVYAVLFVEADVLVYLIFRASRSARAASSGAEGTSEPPATGFFLKGSRVDALASLVKWASRGSDYSRREVAQMTARMLSHSLRRNEGPSGLASAKVSEALRTIIYPYRDDQAVKSELANLVGSPVYDLVTEQRDGGRSNDKAGRARYLESLEAVVSSFGQDLDRV
jgi:hypothetical protein